MKHKFLSCMLTIVVGLLYFKSWKYGFVFDDYLHIILEERIRSISTSYFAFWEPLLPGNLYRPLLILSYSITYFFVGLEPALYHITNVLLHTSNVCLVFYILQRFVSSKESFLIALIFSVHPLLSEAVANISGRSELLAHFFGLLSLLLALKFMESKYVINKYVNWFLVFCVFTLALFSKESALNYIAILFPVCLFARHANLKTKLIVSLTYFLSVGIYMVFRISALSLDSAFGGNIDYVDNPLIELNTYLRVLNALYLLGYYLMLLLVPFRMSADYSYAQFITSLTFRPEQWVLIVSILVVFLSGIEFTRRKDVRGFFILWFFAAFLITSNVFFSIGTVFADRLTYLPSIGIIGLFVVNFSRILDRKLGSVIAIVFSLVYFLITFNHIDVWKSNLSLWEHQLKVAPLSLKAAGNYGAALVEEGRYAEAIPYLEESIQQMPGAAMPKILLKRAKKEANLSSDSKIED